MQRLEIEKTDDTPGIILDKQHGIFEISGRSLPEDSVDFFQPVLDWLSAYAQSPNDTTDFVFKLEYSNTASSKYIHDILMRLEKIKNARVTWCYLDQDEDMLDSGKEFAEQMDLPFEFKTF